MKNFCVLPINDTWGFCKTFTEKLTKQGVTEANSVDESDVTIVLCPSSDETEIISTFSNNPGSKPVILVVVHRTFNPDFKVPKRRRVVKNSSVILVVDCLFHETRGFFECPRNENAVREVLKQMDLPKVKADYGMIVPDMSPLPQPSCTRCAQMEALLLKKDQQLKDTEHELELTRDNLREREKKIRKLEVELSDMGAENVKLKEELQKLRRELQDRVEHFEKSGEMKEEESNNHPEEQGGGQQLSIAPLQL